MVDSNRSQTSTQTNPFYNLLKNRKRKENDLSPESRKMLKESVFRLISFHQDKDHVLKQALSSGLVDQQKLPNGGGQAQGISILQHDDVEDVWTSVLSIFRFIQEKITRTASSQILTELQRDEITASIVMLKKLQLSESINYDQLVSLLQKQNFSLEVWWILNKEDIFSIKQYLQWCISEEYRGPSLWSQLLLVMTQTDTGINHRKQILQDYVNSLIKFAFPDKKNDQVSLRRLCMKILDGITKGVLVELNEHKEESILHTVPPADLFKHGVFKKFATHTLSFIMSYSPNIKVSQALKNQDQWKSAKINQVRVHMYKQAEEVLDILNRILERHEVNWENVLSFLATFLVCFKQAPKLIEDHVRGLLVEGLEQGDMENIIVAFLLVRQSCIEGPHVFPSYQQWFTKTFGESGKTVAETKKAFTFLIKFLTDVVPFESAVYLKAHILKPPRVPVKCRSLLSDYIVLAKTRLADLKESLGGAEQETTKVKVNQAEQDVEKALNSFQATGRLPAAVMEASIFRKPYFVGQFIPTLLKPRPLPNVPDVKMKFIKSLRKAEKISTSLYNQYEAGCQREAAKLLEGVFDVDLDEDIEMDDMLLEPLEQLKYRLKQLTECLQKTETTPNKVNEILSHISEKIAKLIEIEKPNNQSESSITNVAMVTVDLNYPQLDPKQVKIVDVLLNFICKMVCLDTQCKKQSDWLVGLTAVIGQHHRLHRALYTRLLLLLTYKNSLLEDHHIVGLSALVSVMTSQSQAYHKVTMVDCQRSNSLLSIINLITDRMERLTSPQLLLRFLTHYFRFCLLKNDVKMLHQEIVDFKILKQFSLLCWRYYQCHQTRTPRKDNSDLSLIIYYSSQFQDLTSDLQITMSDFLSFESNVALYDDLSKIQRWTYHTDVVHNKFLSTDNSTKLCSKLLQKCLSLNSSHASCVCCLKGDNLKSVCELTHLLQGMLYLLPNTGENEPWLRAEYNKYTTQQSDTDKSTTVLSLVQAFVSYMMSLPPYLLFVNQVYDVTPNMVSTTFDFITNNLRLFVNDCCYLSLPMTTYILQGLVAVNLYLEDKKILQQLVKDNILLVSVTIHWSYIKPLWSKLDLPVQNLKIEEKLRTPLREYVENEDNTLPAGNSDVVLAAFVFKIILNRDFQTKSNIFQMLESNSIYKNVQLYLLEMLVCYYSVNLLQGMEKSKTCKGLITMAFSLQPERFHQLLHDKGSNPTFRQTICSSEVNKYLHLTLLRCVAGLCEDDSLRRFLHEENNINVILTCFSDVCEQFEVDPRYKQTIGEIIQLSEFVKKCFRMVPQRYLVSLNQEKIKSCGVDVYNVYKIQLHR